MESISTQVRRRGGGPREIAETQVPRYVTVPHLARRWGVSEAHAYRQIDRGVLPHIRIGLSIRVPLAAIEAYEAAHTRGGGAA